MPAAGEEPHSLNGFDREIENTLAGIDLAVKKCFPGNKADTRRLAEFCHEAVKTVRAFSDRTLGISEAVLGGEAKELLQSDVGPKALRDALKDVLKYAEAKTCMAVEAMRADQMLTIKFGVGGPTPAPERRAGMLLTFEELKEKTQQAVLLHVKRVVIAAEAKLIEASGPLGLQRWGVVTCWALDVWEHILSVNKNIKLGFLPMSDFEGRVPNRIKGGNQLRDIQAGVDENKKEILRVKADMKKALKLLSALRRQVGEVLAELDAVRIFQRKGKCPRGFFILPADKTAWPFAKQADSFFKLFTRDVELYFVCRMFFEELKTAAASSKAELKTLVDGRSNQQTEHELSEPLHIELPKEVVQNHLYAIKLSLKVVKVLAFAASTGLAAGNVIPNLELGDHEWLISNLDSHLEHANNHAEDGAPPESLNVVESSTRRRGRFSKFWLVFKFWRKKPSTTAGTRSLTDAHEVWQGYLDKNYTGGWQDVIRNKFMVRKKRKTREYAYICKRTGKHKKDWVGKR